MTSATILRGRFETKEQKLYREARTLSISQLSHLIEEQKESMTPARRYLLCHGFLKPKRMSVYQEVLLEKQISASLPYPMDAADYC